MYRGVRACSATVRTPPPLFPRELIRHIMSHGMPPEASNSQSDDLSDNHLCAFRMLLEAHRRLVDAVDARLATRDLPLMQYDVLVQLSEAEDHRLRMQELAERVLLSKSGLTRLVDRMEAAGRVTREIATSDARGVFAVLTDSGLAALEAAVPAHRQDVVDLFASAMTEDEADHLAVVLGRVRDRSVRD